MPRLLELAAACADGAIVDIAPRPRRGGRMMALGIVAAALVALLVIFFYRPPSADTPVDRAAFLASLGPTRAVEVRLSYPGAAGYRPYDVARGGAVEESLAFQLLARLERAGDWHGLGVASILRGDLAHAARYLERAGRSGAVDSDRAALAIVEGSAESVDRARELLEGVLAAEPDNAAARWNHALVLARLQRVDEAIAELDRVAAMGEPGWSVEAQARARRLRAAATGSQATEVLLRSPHGMDESDRRRDGGVPRDRTGVGPR